jgi:hypothetical protein
MTIEIRVDDDQDAVLNVLQYLRDATLRVDTCMICDKLIKEVVINNDN